MLVQSCPAKLLVEVTQVTSTYPSSAAIDAQHAVNTREQDFSVHLFFLMYIYHRLVTGQARAK